MTDETKTKKKQAESASRVDEVDTLVAGLETLTRTEIEALRTRKGWAVYEGGVGGPLTPLALELTRPELLAWLRGAVWGLTYKAGE